MHGNPLTFEMVKLGGIFYFLDTMTTMYQLQNLFWQGLWLQIRLRSANVLREFSRIKSSFYCWIPKLKSRAGDFLPISASLTPRVRSFKFYLSAPVALFISHWSSLKLYKNIGLGFWNAKYLVFCFNSVCRFWLFGYPAVNNF